MPFFPFLNNQVDTVRKAPSQVNRLSRRVTPRTRIPGKRMPAGTKFLRKFRAGTATKQGSFNNF